MIVLIGMVLSIGYLFEGFKLIHHEFLDKKKERKERKCLIAKGEKKIDKQCDKLSKFLKRKIHQSCVVN